MDEREQILRFLFGLAIASDDHKLQPSEDLAIAEISVQLGIDERTYQKIRELYSSPEEQEPPPPPEPPLPPENEKYRKDYEIIGLNPNATNKEVIKAWRVFNKQCHPDRQPPKKRAEAEKVYKEKIPSWDRIRKLRGLR